jgi:transposase, IS5 family
VLVQDSITLRRFCRIPLTDTVAHPTTLMKIMRRCGAGTVEGLHDRLIAKAIDEHDVKGEVVRGDTTVVEAEVTYPTDSGLLAKAVRRMVVLVRRIQAAGGARRTRVRDRTRAASRRARSIAANLKRRTGEAKETVRRITGELADLAAKMAADANRALTNARRTLKQRGGTGRLQRAVCDLQVLIARTLQIVAQTRLRLSGTTPPGASRLVSLHDPDARPINKGRLGKPVEFGFKAQVIDNPQGIVLDYQVEIGNPPDAQMLAPAIERIMRRSRHIPTAVTADRGYGQADVEAELTRLGIPRVAIPTKGRPSHDRRQHQAARWFRDLVIWRTGAEGRISCLKRDFGWARTHLDGITGARIWCGYGVFNHNLVKLATIG